MSADPGSIAPMRAPFTYVIDYSGRYLNDPAEIDAFADAPPDLMHVGRTVPVTHNWGPAAVLWGENQYTGRPRGKTHRGVWREGIRLLSPDELRERIAMLEDYTARWHQAGVRWLTPYSAVNTIGGDHETREGFWAFYDRWDDYAEWLGPRPETDPTDWLMRDREGAMVPGACGGFSPPYYAPLHRYRTCTEHPAWLDFQRRLTRLIAEVGYDGVFPDNCSVHDVCFCGRCREAFRTFVGERPDRELAILGAPRDADLMNESISEELVRRFRIEQVARYQTAVRNAGREVNPDFIVFPNVNSFEDFMRIAETSDVLMFESTYMAGCTLPEPPSGTGDICVEVVEGKAGSAGPQAFYLSVGARGTHAALCAEVRVHPTVPCGAPTPVELDVEKIGRPFRPTQRASNFELLLTPVDGGDPTAVPLTPPVTLGNSGADDVTAPPVALRGEWTPDTPGRYRIALRYAAVSEADVENPRYDEAPVAETNWDAQYQTHIGQMLFTMHAAARTVSLDYGTRYRPERDALQELQLAECAAFSSGSTVTAWGGPLKKYAPFFRAKASRYEGFLPHADIGLLYAWWGHNPETLDTGIMDATPMPAPVLAARQRPIKTLADRTVNEADFASLRSLVLCGHRLEMSDAQVTSLQRFRDRGGALFVYRADTTLNGAPLADTLGNVALWTPATDVPGLPPLIDNAEGGELGLRFSVYAHPDTPRMTLHVLNYNVTLREQPARMTPVEGASVAVPLKDPFTVRAVRVHDPDRAEVAEPAFDRRGDTLHLTLPPVRIYQLVDIAGA